MKYLNRVLLSFLVLIFLACSNNDSEEILIPSKNLFDLKENHLIIKGSEESYSFNFIPDTHWLKGVVKINGELTSLKGFQFDEKSILEGIEIFDVNKQEVVLVISKHKIKFQNFVYDKNALLFQSINDYGDEASYIINHDLIKIDKDKPMSVNFANMVQSTLNHSHLLNDSEAFDLKLTWSCVTATAVVTIGGVALATINHCKGVINSVKQACDQCIKSSFCSSECVKCPEK